MATYFWKNIRFITGYLFIINFIALSEPIYASNMRQVKTENQIKKNVRSTLKTDLAISKLKNEKAFWSSLDGNKLQKKTYSNNRTVREKIIKFYSKSNKLDCQSNVNLPNDRQCGGTFNANSQEELDVYYSSNYGLSNNKYKNLSINFAPVTTEILLKTPCKLTISHDLHGSELCALGRTGIVTSSEVNIEFDNSVTMFSQAGDVHISSYNNLSAGFLRLHGGVNFSTGNNTSVTANGLLVFADIGNIVFGQYSNLSGGGAFIEALGNNSIGQYSEINFQYQLNILADSPGKNVSIGQNSVVNAGSVFLAAFGGGSLVIDQGNHVNTSQGALKMFSNGIGTIQIKQNSIVNVSSLDLTTGGSIVLDQYVDIISQSGASLRSTSQGNYRVQMSQYSKIKANQDIEMTAIKLAKLDQFASIITNGNFNLDGSVCDVHDSVQLKAKSNSGRCAPPLIVPNKSVVSRNSIVVLNLYSIQDVPESIQGQIGQVSVEILKASGNHLTFLAPELSPGSYNLEFTVMNRVFVIPLEYTAPSIVTDPELIISQVRSAAENIVDFVPVEFTQERQKIAEYLDEFDSILSTLSQDDRASLALLIVTNPDFFNFSLNKIGSFNSSNTTEQSVMDASTLIINKTVFYKSAAVVAAAALVLSTKPTGWVQGAAFAALIGGLATLAYNTKFIKEHLPEVLVRSVDLIVEQYFQKTKTMQGFQFTSGQPKAFTAKSYFHSINKHDVETTDETLSWVVKQLRENYSKWSSFNFSNIFPNLIPVDIDSLEPNGQNQILLPLSPSYISLSDVTDGVTGFSQANSNNFFLTFNSANSTTFNFNIEYHPTGFLEGSRQITDSSILANVYGCLDVYPPNGVIGYIQQNGGGFVAGTSNVQPSVFINESSQVCDQATITGTGISIVNSTIRGKAIIQADTGGKITVTNSEIGSSSTAKPILFSINSGEISISNNTNIKGESNFFTNNFGKIFITSAQIGDESLDRPLIQSQGLNSVIIDQGAKVYGNATVIDSAQVSGIGTEAFENSFIGNNGKLTNGAKAKNYSFIYQNAIVTDKALLNINAGNPQDVTGIFGSVIVSNTDTLIENTTLVHQNAQVINGAKIRGANNRIGGNCIINYGEWFQNLNVPDENGSCAPFSQGKRKEKATKKLEDYFQMKQEAMDRRNYYLSLANNMRNG